MNTDELESAILRAEIRVLNIQTKLHRWASDDPHRRFDDVFNLVVDPGFLLVAWDRVRRNKGARTAGIDGETARYVEVFRGVDLRPPAPSVVGRLAVFGEFGQPLDAYSEGCGRTDRILLSNPDTADWHKFGMEWKEHIAWISPILATTAAFIVLYYGTNLIRHDRVRKTAIVLLTAAFRVRRRRRGAGRPDHQVRTGPLRRDIMSTPTQLPSQTGQTGVEGIHYPDRPEGPIAAAILAAGLGALALGVVTTLVEASASIKKALTLSTAVGPLSGKVAIAIGAWIVAWIVLHLVYRNKPYETRRALTIALILIGLGVIGTFPTFFQMFGG